MARNAAAERGREVRERLLRAAVELITERGWSAVSTRLLAERAGVAPGLVHYHFTSVQALLAEAAVATMGGLIDAAQESLARAGGPEQLLEQLLGMLEDFSGLDPTSLLFVETYLAATRDQRLREAVAGLITRFTGRLAGWLAAHGVDHPAETAAVLAAAIDGVLLHRAMNPALTASTVAPVLRRAVLPSRGKAGDRP